MRRRRGEKSKQTHTKAHKPFLKRLLVWGAIHASGPVPIVIMKGTLDSSKYLEILENNALPFSYEIGIYQHDNAPPHKAKQVQSRLYHYNLPVLDWPAMSPDLNCIENIWAILKQKVHRRYPSTLEELQHHVLDIWQNDVELKAACCSCVESMPKRVEKTIYAKGGYIKY